MHAQSKVYLCDLVGWMLGVYIAHGQSIMSGSLYVYHTHGTCMQHIHRNKDEQGLFHNTIKYCLYYYNKKHRALVYIGPAISTDIEVIHMHGTLKNNKCAHRCLTTILHNFLLFDLFSTLPGKVFV